MKKKKEEARLFFFFKKKRKKKDAFEMLEKGKEEFGAARRIGNEGKE